MGQKELKKSFRSYKKYQVNAIRIAKAIQPAMKYLEGLFKNILFIN